MPTITPRSPEEFAAALVACAATGQHIALAGQSTKTAMAGPIAPADATLSTAGLNRILQFEPDDLTISVEAGLAITELDRTLSKHRLMLPLDPPFSERATVGGVLAANTCGPRRRLYGTARDMVIGMKYATLEGKIIQSGGMVVKNVAGLDTAKLMIGSFGTLAAIVSANFKLVPMPPCSRTFALRFASLLEAIAARDRILRGVLQPAAIDLLNPAGAARLGQEGFLLLAQALGNAAVVERYARELPEATAFEGDSETSLWRAVREFTPVFLAEVSEGAVVRVSSTITGLEPVLQSLDVPALARAGTGVCHAYFPNCEAAAGWMREAARRGWKCVIEFAPPARKERLDLWPSPGSDFGLMERVKELFDPRRLLNSGRLYGRI